MIPRFDTEHLHKRYRTATEKVLRAVLLKYFQPAEFEITVLDNKEDDGSELVIWIVLPSANRGSALQEISRIFEEIQRILRVRPITETVHIELIYSETTAEEKRAIEIVRKESGIMLSFSGLERAPDLVRSIGNQIRI